MQAVWLIFDDLAGKGVTVSILAKYVFYVSIVIVPQAVPIAVLLASIMTLGNFSEKYEFAAAKSAGLSLQQLVAPLFIFVIGLSFVNLFFLNNAYPWAVLKQKNLYKNIKDHKPALAFVEGTFNTEIKDFIIRFDEKYGEEDNLLKNVLIYQIKDYNTLNTITAKHGSIVTNEGSRYMSLLLEDGYFYEEHWNRRSKKKEKETMPFSKTHFDTYKVNIDISAFSSAGINDIVYSNSRDMLSFSQLHYFSDSLKTTYDDYIVSRSKRVRRHLTYDKLYENKDSIAYYEIIYPILDNFTAKQQEQVASTAVTFVERSLKTIESKSPLKRRRKQLNLIDTEYHRRIALSFSALLLFLIGVPLGSLIRKGGFGLPMVIAIVVYLAYHFLSEFAKNMAKESTLTDIFGGWLSTLIFLPIAIYLTYRATKDKGAINFTSILSFSKKIKDKYSKRGEAIQKD